MGELELMYERTQSLIFGRIANRIREKQEELNITNYQLAGFEDKTDYLGWYALTPEERRKTPREGVDYAMISNIRNGKINKKRNPNLISDHAIIHLTNRLDFENEVSLLWGNIDQEFIAMLFNQMIRDVLEEKKNNDTDIILRMMMGYVPFAEKYTLGQMFIDVDGTIELAEMNDGYYVPPYFYNISEDELRNTYEDTKKHAIEYVFLENKKELEGLYKKFMLEDIKNNGDYSLKKIKNKLSTLMKEIVDYFNNNLTPDEALGMRARTILVSDYKKASQLLSDKMNRHDDTLQFTVKNVLLKSSLEYVASLKRVQAVELNVIGEYNFREKWIGPKKEIKVEKKVDTLADLEQISKNADYKDIKKLDSDIINAIKEN